MKSIIIKESMINTAKVLATHYIGNGIWELYWNLRNKLMKLYNLTQILSLLKARYIYFLNLCLMHDIDLDLQYELNKYLWNCWNHMIQWNAICFFFPNYSITWKSRACFIQISLAFLTLSFLIYLQSYFSFTGILICFFLAFLIFVWCLVLEECSNVLEIGKIINTYKMYTFQYHVHLKNPCWYYIDKKRCISFRIKSPHGNTLKIISHSHLISSTHLSR